MRNKIIYLFTTLFIVILMNSIPTSVAQEDHHDADSDCHDATEFITIEAHASEVSYNKDDLTVSKNTCVQITFMNKNPLVEHDFTIDDFGGPHTDRIHIHLDNSTDGHMGMGMKSINVTTPDVDKTFKFYCTVLGHEPTMNGNLIVGEGSSEDDSLPGFEFLILLSSMAVLILPAKKLRNKKLN
ncbi:MAG: cupredoxin domain-containing protein [Candidatus Kariarchaeaceae archaeon]|jgi:azurin